MRSEKEVLETEHHHDWILEKIENRVAKLMAGKIGQSLPAPPGKALRISHIVSPPEKTRAILASSTKIARIECICRKNKPDRCKAPVDVCLITDSRLAEDSISEDKGTEVSPSEAMSILDGTTEFGLVHMLLQLDDREYQAICSCCSCCCHDIIAVLEHDHKIVERSEYVAHLDADKCTNCGVCVQYCNFKAWTSGDEGDVDLLTEKCFGCGVCVVHCPVEAISLLDRPRDLAYAD
jgi:Pyruvate/2-oxoacid:ferredoxin oxidoreductase delta subunit